MIIMIIDYDDQILVTMIITILIIINVINVKTILKLYWSLTKHIDY